MSSRWLKKKGKKGVPVPQYHHYFNIFALKYDYLHENNAFNPFLPFFSYEKWSFDNLDIFLHYNKKGSKNSKENEYDKRPFIGLPAWYKGFKK